MGKENAETLVLDAATPEAAVSLLRAGLAHDQEAVQTILRTTSHAGLVMLLAGMAEGFGLQLMCGDKDELDRLLARWLSNQAATWPPRL